MSEQRTPQEYRVGTGASVMLLIFLVMCLVTLGILSLLSARADRTLSRRSAQYTQAYYEGLDAATALYARIAGETRGMDAQALARYAQENDYDFDNDRLYYSVDAGFERVINVALAFDGGAARMTGCALENIGEWDADSLTLFTF